MSDELELSALYDRLQTLKNSGFKPIYITFMGGEFTILKNSIEYMKIVNEFYPFSYKSLTTNGSAPFIYYEKLPLYGINNITFSLNELGDSLKSKIEMLGTNSFFTIRTNIYLNLNNYEKIERLLCYCMSHHIPATFCADIKSSVPETSEIIKFLDLSNWNVSEHPNHIVFTNEEYIYSFWVFHHKGNYKGDNYIILPNGQITSNFKNVLDCRGVRGSELCSV